MKQHHLFLLLSAFLTLSACQPSSDDLANHQQEQLSKQSVQAVGLPSIINFQEKRILKMVLELRDSEKLPTFTYIVDLNGGLHLLCGSIGYGIPYATQYTSPQKFGGQGLALPQADPNGLFSPAAADGTWVLCAHDGKLAPLYVEPHIIVSPFALK